MIKTKYEWALETIKKRALEYGSVTDTDVARALYYLTELVEIDKTKKRFCGRQSISLEVWDNINIGHKRALLDAVTKDVIKFAVEDSASNVAHRFDVDEDSQTLNVSVEFDIYSVSTKGDM